MTFSREHQTKFKGGMAPGPLPELGIGAAGGMAGPVSVHAVRRDGQAYPLPSRTAFNPRDLQPVRQLIFGGPYQSEADAYAYRFGVGDRIALHVSRHPELSGEITVLNDGTVELPLVHERVMARDYTLERLSKKITLALEPYVRKKPEIDLSVTLSANQFYYVLGEVRNPGRYPLGPADVRVSEAVFRANSAVFGRSGMKGEEGDVTDYMRPGARSAFKVPERADMENVCLITPHRSRPQKRSVNVRAAIYNGARTDDPVLKPGQIVFVPPVPEETDGEDAAGERETLFSRLFSPLDPDAATAGEGSGREAAAAAEPAPAQEAGTAKRNACGQEARSRVELMERRFNPMY